ncbi:MAG: hypothetical protein ACYTHN_02655 [Planctomycetota bacterium]
MEKQTCLWTGDRFYLALDTNALVKRPHLSFLFGLGLPTGRDDVRHEGELLPSRIQPGTGVFTPRLGMEFTQGLSRLAATLGVAWANPLGKNDAGLERSPALSFSLGVTWHAWEERHLNFDATLLFDRRLENEALDGVVQRGTRGTETSATLGGSLALSPKFAFGVLLSFTLSDTREAVHGEHGPGWGAGVFLVLSFDDLWREKDMRYVFKK